MSVSASYEEGQETNLEQVLISERLLDIVLSTSILKMF